MEENNKKTKLFATMVLGVAIAFSLGIMAGSFWVGSNAENNSGEGFEGDDDFQVSSDVPSGFGELPIDALSREEAKELGVEYILEMFGTHIDVTSVIMYHDNESLNATAIWNGHWHGEVKGTEGETFHFIIDAVSGERISALDEEVWHKRGDEPGSSPILHLSDTQRDVYVQTAMEYTQKHFSR